MRKKRIIILIILLLVLNFNSAKTAIAAAAETESSASAPEEPQKYDSLDSLFNLYQPYLKNISAYKPIYFLSGTNPQKSRFQFSFKYVLFNQDSPLAERHGWLKGLHFAFTQTSFWDLKSSSKPFEDTSYKPELFFLSQNLYKSDKTLRRIFLQTGLQHESNGRGETDSRSTNFYYFKPFFVFFDEKKLLGLQLAPNLWTYIANDDELNPDIDDYRGYADLELKCGKADSLILESHLRPARKGNSLQIDLSYPLDKYLCSNCNVYLHVQYTNSLAENLLNYKERIEALRIGISIVR